MKNTLNQEILNMDSTALMNCFFCEMLGSHRSEHKDLCLVECDVMKSVKWVPQKHGYFFARLHSSIRSYKTVIFKWA